MDPLSPDMGVLVCRLLLVLVLFLGPILRVLLKEPWEAPGEEGL